MNFSVVFEPSGDVIPFQAINPDVLEYYVDQISNLGLNKFSADREQVSSVVPHVKGLKNTIENINRWLGPLVDVQLPVVDINDYLDQNLLNSIHALWVRLQYSVVDIDSKRVSLEHSELIEKIHDAFPDSERYPRLGDVVGKIGKKLEFDSINVPWVHGLESKFDAMRFRCHENWIEIGHPFAKSKVTFDICNIYLPFHHLGRSQYDKFITFDQDHVHQDENTFNELLGWVEISFRRPETKSFSREYLDYCVHSGREPSGELIPLGNIPNLSQNLHKYRILMLNNILSKNKFQIHLHTG